jgi:uncharacterized membrane protein YfcA
MEHYVILILILSISAFLQSIAGFGFSLIALPLMLTANVGFVDAVMLCVVCSAFQKIISLICLREHIDRVLIKQLLVWGCVGVVLGVACLHYVSALTPAVVKKIVAILILFILAVRWLVKLKPLEQSCCLLNFLASFTGGFLCGFANIGGPPMVMLSLCYNWTAPQMRVMVLAFVTFLMPVQLITMFLTFGDKVLGSGVQGLSFAPVVMVFSYVGVRVGNKLNVSAIRVVMTGLLIIVAVVNLFVA